MENLDLLTDDQLRIRLNQYGFGNLPVTDTTRKVLLKKLKLAVEGQKTKNRRETVAVTKFSSDEEPEDAKRGAKREKTPNRRATVAVSEKTKKSSNGAANGLEDITTTTTTTSTTSKPASRRASRATPAKEKPVVSSTILLDDTDEDIPLASIVTRRSYTPTLAKSDVVRTSYKTTNVEVVQESQEEDSYEEEVPQIRKPTPVMPNLRKTFTTSTHKVQERSTPTKFGRASLITSFNPRGNYKFNKDDDEDDEPLEINDETAPYLSNFAKRLSTLKAEPLGSPRTTEVYRSSNEYDGRQSAYTSSRYSAASSQKAVARKTGFWKEIGTIYDLADKKYNFRTILYLIFIIMVIVAIYVILI